MDSPDVIGADLAHADMSDLVTRLRRKTVAGQPVFPSPIELEAADRIATLESQLATTTALLNAGAERIKELEATVARVAVAAGEGT